MVFVLMEFIEYENTNRRSQRSFLVFEKKIEFGIWKEARKIPLFKTPEISKATSITFQLIQAEETFKYLIHKTNKIEFQN